MSAVIRLRRGPCTDETQMRVEYCIVLRDKGWMIERQGQSYGPYSSKQVAVREANYVANYSTSHGLRAQVRAHKSDELLARLRTIMNPLGRSGEATIR
jgi:hypothetical protein